MDRPAKKVAFPHVANYNSAVRYIIEKGTNAHFIMPPQMTRRTMEIGTKASPDYVCTPFKSSLGNLIEALEAGADTLIMPNGLCRLGYYGELQERILRDMGYEFEMINFSEYITGKIKDVYKGIKQIDPKVNVAKFALAAKDGLKMGEYIDEITELYYKDCGFEVQKGSFRRVYRQFLVNMQHADSKAEIEAGYLAAKQAFAQLAVEKPLKPLRVGIVGEFFTVMDAFSNLDVEQHLADMGVEVYRWMNVKNRMLHYSGEKNLNIKIRELCKYEMGPTSTANIWCAKEYAERGFDGLIHVKSAGCTPEIDVMPVLQRISEQYKIPVLYLTYDSQTSDVGLMTRLEAFYDMIEMRKQRI